MSKQQTAINILGVTVALLLVAVAAMAFFLSFHNIRHFAEIAEISPEWSWVLAVLIDAAMLVFSLSALLAMLQMRFKWLEHGLPVAATGAISVIFNVWEPQTDAMLNIARISAHVVPPVLLVAAFESNMQNIRAWLDVSASSADLTAYRSLRWRANTLIQIAKHWKARAIAAEKLANAYGSLAANSDGLAKENARLSSDNDGLAKENARLTKSNSDLASEVSWLAKTPPMVIDIAKTYASGGTPNGNIVNAHPISESDMKRFDKAVQRSINR